MKQYIRPLALRSADNKIERHATWLEIFFDLIYAVIIFQLSERLFHNLSVIEIIQCASLFIPVMWTWASYTVFAARFDNNDIIHWTITFITMFAGVIMAIHIPTGLESGANGFTIGFLIAQISLFLLYVKTLYDHVSPQNIAWLYVIGFGLANIVWITSLFFLIPEKFLFWALGMCIYLFIPWLGRKRILSKAPLDSVYIPERFGAFTIIILGQIIASVVFGLEIATLSPSAVLTSIFAFMLAILIWGQYYRFNQVANYQCTLGSGQPYIYTHIPLIISLIVIGVCTQDFITKPTVLHNKINIIFCFAIITYLISFYLLQSIAIEKTKPRFITCLGGITASIFIFLYFSLSPMIIMLSIVILFTILFIIQFRLGAIKKINN